MTKNEKKYIRKNRDDRDLKEEAVFLITALSLTGFYAHYVGITVYSILVVPDPNQVGLSLYLVL